MKSNRILMTLLFAVFGSMFGAMIDPVASLPVAGAMGLLAQFVSVPAGVLGSFAIPTEGLNEKEIKMANGIAAEMDRLFKELKAGQLTEDYVRDQIKELEGKLDENAKVKALFEKGQKEMQNQFDELAVSIKKGINSDTRKKSLNAFVREQLEKQLDKIKTVVSNSSDGTKVGFEIDMKSVGDMTFANSITGEIPQAFRLPGYNEVARRMPFIRELINNAITAKPTISYVYEVTGEGGADTTTEGSTKNQLDGDFAVGSVNVAKYTVYMRISEEMLEDIDFMASFVASRLMQDLGLKVDAVILAAIISGSTAFAAGTFAGAITSANKFDALKVAINQILIANHMPNYIVMHPSDVTAMELEKDGNNMYLLPPFASASGMQVSGVKIVANTGVTVDKFVVFDGTKITAFFRNQMRMETGRNGNDFVQNMMTSLAEVRFATLIETNDATAIVYGDFSEAIAALDSGS